MSASSSGAVKACWCLSCLISCLHNDALIRGITRLVSAPRIVSRVWGISTVLGDYRAITNSWCQY